MEENIKNELENNKYIKNNKIDNKFVFQNFGKCVEFLNEMTQTIGITPMEHECLKNVSIRKVKFESRGGHWAGVAFAIIQARYFLKSKYTIVKLLLAVSYPVFLFDIYYNFGRQCGNFLSMQKNLNDILSLKNGKSIQSIQTHLFVKRCVYDQILEKNKIMKPETVGESYFFSQVFGKSYLRIKKFKSFILSFQNKKRNNPNDNINEN